jgi:hypothetical protein
MSHSFPRSYLPSEPAWADAFERVCPVSFKTSMSVPMAFNVAGKPALPAHLDDDLADLLWSAAYMERCMDMDL